MIARPLSPIPFRRFLCFAGFFLFLLPASSVRADSITGADWIVTFNRPDQTTTATGIGEGEFDIRDAFVSRIDALQSGDSAILASYTFSGGGEANGGAGTILRAISNALARGASVGFVADFGIDVSSNFWPGCSLDSLSKRSGNKLTLARSPSTGIMHDKIGVFTYKSTGDKWLLTASWNFTAGASSQQWNILLQTRNGTLHAACSNELNQMLTRKRFHDSADKAHLDTPFRTENSHGDGLIRFAPYASAAAHGENALTAITNLIAHATSSIWFALNKQTRPAVTDQLIAAANRGVEVHGVIPKSDRNASNKASYEQYRRLADRSEYTSANRVRMHDAYVSDARTDFDDGRLDLVHCKYMVIDPGTAAPWVVHGSANWTATALSYANAANVNDENILFLPDSALAFAFLRQFSAMTGVDVPVDDPDAPGLSCTPGTGTLFCTVPRDFRLKNCQLVGTTNPISWSHDWTHPLLPGTTALAPPVEKFPFLLVRMEGE